MYFVASCICVTTAHGPRLTQHPLMHYHSAWAPVTIWLHKRIRFVSIRCNNQHITVCLVIIWCNLVRKHLVVVDVVRNPFFYVMFEHRSMDFGMRNPQLWECEVQIKIQDSSSRPSNSCKISKILLSSLSSLSSLSCKIFELFHKFALLCGLCVIP